jgi:Uma2 family endonuclease
VVAALFGPGDTSNVSIAPKVPTVYERWLAVPDHQNGEIIDGELVVTPRPAPKHSQAASALGAKLVGPFQFGDGGGPGGWVILDEPEIHLADHIIVPDLAGWRRERYPSTADAAFFEIAPDWVCEILSPSTARVDRGKKMAIYAAWGVPHLWLLDPTLQLLEVYRLSDAEAPGSPRRLWMQLAVFAESAVVHTEPFQDVALNLAARWTA